MKGQFYRIDWDTCDRLHLYGREAMVYSALLYLCKKAPYTGTAMELADFSCCGSDDTALRMLKTLQKKGLIMVDAIGIRLTGCEYRTQKAPQNAVSLPQNAVGLPQNAVSLPQNAVFSKEKEKNQKNKEKINEVVVVGAKDVPSQPQPQPLFFNFVAPSWQEIVTYAQQKNVPLPLCKKFFAYYSANNWTLKRGVKMQNWQAALAYWLETESAAKSSATAASVQEQAAFAGSQYSDYRARKALEQKEDQQRQADEQNRFVTYEEYLKEKLARRVFS